MTDVKKPLPKKTIFKTSSSLYEIVIKWTKTTTTYRENSHFTRCYYKLAADSRSLEKFSLSEGDIHNHEVKFLGIFDPSPFVVNLLNKAYVSPLAKPLPPQMST